MPAGRALPFPAAPDLRCKARASRSLQAGRRTLVSWCLSRTRGGAVGRQAAAAAVCDRVHPQFRVVVFDREAVHAVGGAERLPDHGRHAGLHRGDDDGQHPAGPARRPVEPQGRALHRHRCADRQFGGVRLQPWPGLVRRRDLGLGAVLRRVRGDLRFGRLRRGAGGDRFGRGLRALLRPGADVRGHGVHHQCAGLRRGRPLLQPAGRVLPDDSVHLLCVPHLVPVPRAQPAPHRAQAAPGGPSGPDRARRDQGQRRLDRGRAGGQLRGHAPADRVLPALVPRPGTARALVRPRLRADVLRRLGRRRARQLAARQPHGADRRARHAGDRLRPVRPRPARGSSAPRSPRSSGSPS